MMDCAKATEALYLYIDNALSASQRRELDMHLLGCSKCCHELKIAKALQASLRALPEQDLPLDFSARLHAALAAEAPPERLGVWQRGWVKSLTVAACLLLVIGITGQFIGGGSRQNDSWFADQSTSDSMLLADIAPMAVAEQEFGGEFYDGDFAARGRVAMGMGSEVIIQPQMMDSAVLLTDNPESSAGGTDSALALEDHERMIIHNANVSLEVEQADEALDQLQALAQRFGGYVASSNIFNFDDFSSGFVQLRVAAAYLEVALAEIGEIGEVTSQGIDSQDVTLTYIDIQGRLQQYRSQESRLLEIMTQAYTVEDLVTIERELTRLRSQIESLSGQIRYFQQRTALSTININFFEAGHGNQGGVLNQLGQGISNGFSRGISTMAHSTTSLIVGFFSIIPALLVIIVIALIILLLVRRRKVPRK